MCNQFSLCLCYFVQAPVQMNYCSNGGLMPDATYIYLQDRKQIVDTSGYYSKAAATNIGGTQELTLGPLIFLNCINDLPTSLSSLKCIPYADDVIFSSNHCISMLTNMLTSMLNEGPLKIYTSYEHNKLQMSHNKTVYHPPVCMCYKWVDVNFPFLKCYSTLWVPTELICHHYLASVFARSFSIHFYQQSLDLSS